MKMKLEIGVTERGLDERAKKDEDPARYSVSFRAVLTQEEYALLIDSSELHMVSIEVIQEKS